MTIIIIIVIMMIMIIIMIIIIIITIINFIYIASISLTVLGALQYPEKRIKTTRISIKIRYKSIYESGKGLVK